MKRKHRGELLARKRVGERWALNFIIDRIRTRLNAHMISEALKQDE